MSIFLDLSKAFDSLDHSILLLKLFRYGFHGNAHKWLSNYVHNRNQYVFINGHESKRNKMLYGVPQGSILGPLLFLIYINGLVAVSDTTMPLLFVDDTSIFVSNRNITTLIRDLNYDLINYSTWFQTNKLSLNVKKSNFILFAGKRKYNSEEIKLHIQVSTTRFLENVCKKVTKCLGILRKIRDFVHNSCFLTLYYTLIYPYLTYCNIV